MFAGRGFDVEVEDSSEGSFFFFFLLPLFIFPSFGSDVGCCLPTSPTSTLPLILGHQFLDDAFRVDSGFHSSSLSATFGFQPSNSRQSVSDAPALLLEHRLIG